MTNDEIELAFIREFQALGEDLGVNISRAVRMDRIRIGIFRERRDGKLFHDSGMTYTQAFKKCFGRTAELRALQRDQIGRPVHEVIDELSDGSDDDAE